MSSNVPSKKSTVTKQTKPGQSHRGRKPTPKQPVPVPDRLKRLFNSLCAQIDGGHFSNAIKTCDKILRLAPDDPDALQTKLFLYLQTEQYAPALESVGSNDFEKAYLLYRMQKEDQAGEILKEIKQADDQNRGAMHLEAQLSYRQGSYQTAVDLYNQLLDTCDPESEEHSDILNNLQAAQQHLDFMESGFLRSLDTLPAALRNNVDSLPPPSSQQPGETARVVSVNVDITAPTVQKKVRMSRVPKGVIPGVTPPPDPERWLKKSERSTVQSQGKKKKGGGGGATQGSSAGLEYNAVVPSGGGGGGSSGKGKGKKKK